MTPLPPCRPRVLGLFGKRIEGDDSLMALAALRFSQAGLGAEIHAGTPGEFEWALGFRPWADAPVVAHLPRAFNLADENSRRQIAELASRFAGRISGFVVHDHPDLVSQPAASLRAARELDARLQGIDRCPWLFVEYAAGLDPDAFAGFFRSVRDLSRVSACLDIGHLGIWQARRAYSRMHPGEDICALKCQAEGLPRFIEDAQTAVESALSEALRLIEELGALGKPTHFHLHDAHPLWTGSPFGVSDHLSFLAEVPLGFEFRGRRCAPLMFGPGGLSRIVAAALKVLDAQRVSFTLEIHPDESRVGLGDAAGLFGHWRDMTNAERMNGWLSTILENHRLLLSSIDAVACRQPQESREFRPYG